jgi:serine/threonine-protein kinase
VADDQSLLDVAAALADGALIDWESAAHSITNETDRALLAELQFISAVTHVHRSLGDSSRLAASGDPSTSGEAAVLGERARAAAYWGPLEIIEPIGHGTFGDVYRAWDTRLDREVALKILRRRERDETRESTVIQEGRLLARVRHPNVVTVYGAERVDGRVGVWMEYIPGKTLEEELRDHGPFDIAHVVKIGIELAGALSAVHRAGLIHRDVKAHNVMRDGNGRLVLTDFGAGCDLEETPNGAARELAGTPVYVAPEVLAGQPATPQSDIYSLGVLLYYLLCGTYPVRGRSLKEVREVHANGTRVPLRQALPDLPPGVARIIDGATDPDPRERYETPDMLGAALAMFISSTSDARGPVTHTTGLRGRYAALAVLLVLAVAGGLLAAWRTSETPANGDRGTTNRTVVGALDSDRPKSRRVGHNTHAQPLAQTVTVIEFPGATRTYPLEVNDVGVIVGSYTLTTASEPTHGFLLSDGTFTTIDVPGAVRTRPTGLNNSGAVVGDFTDANGVVHGFHWFAHTFTVIDASEATYTRANAINGVGDVAGDYRDANGTARGFLLSGGVFSNIDVPGATSTRAFGLNDEGAVVGDYRDSAGVHGFLFMNNHFTTIDAPGATDTQAFRVNARGTIVGAYGFPSRHGFLLRKADFTPIDVPGAFRTEVTAINAFGVIVGSYLGGTPTKVRGFLLTP